MARKPRLANVPSGQLCECGCGQETMLAARTYSDRNIRAGEPRRFVAGHGARSLGPVDRFRLPLVVVKGKPNPGGLCWCGCGAEVGTHRRWARSHHLRLSPVDYVVAPDGCWVWQRGVDVHGYGKTVVDGQRRIAHRVYFERHVGPIPAGHDVHHVCENKRCVNPEHLEALTPEEHGRLHGEVWRRAA